ncbi:hypothetical protein Pcinc_042062 [Petrolisthes cinctipes]|uniref:Uncharacterized protein n=1 Tax=Petrolisthes cinctipes TaxID=88211 RepID=A0AAE1BIR0_PETCI|nr:hypothetical protein Pcinc_042062 [Petrolisthes cinctipes]
MHPSSSINPNTPPLLSSPPTKPHHLSSPPTTPHHISFPSLPPHHTTFPLLPPHLHPSKAFGEVLTRRDELIVGEAECYGWWCPPLTVGLSALNHGARSNAGHGNPSSNPPHPSHPPCPPTTPTFPYTETTIP